MPSLFRYIEATHANALIHQGEVLFRALSYYRDYEDEGVRSDALEGTLVHRPKDGLKATVVATGEVIPLAYTFESTANEDDIFVYCLSTELSPSLATRFKVDACVEILNPAKFLSHIRNALLRRPSIKDKLLVCDLVNYYEPHDQPLADWALPEKIALSKPSDFGWQNEYRIAFATNNAFQVKNVSVSLVPLDNNRKSRSSVHPQQLLRLGNISNICKVHYF